MADIPPFPVGHNPAIGRVADWVELVALSRRHRYKRGELKAATLREDLDNPALIEQKTWQELRTRAEVAGARWPLRFAANHVSRCRPAPVDLTIYRYMCAFGLGVDPADRQLFEEVSAHLARPLFGAVEVLRIGHPAGNSMSRSFGDRIDQYVNDSGIKDWEVKTSVLTTDNDLGLDVVAWQRFADDRGGGLHYLIQCATGSDWKSKLADIDLEVWKDHIHWAVPPVRVFATPLALSLSEARWIRANRTGGLILDRHRLMELSLSTTVPAALMSSVRSRLTALGLR